MEEIPPILILQVDEFWQLHTIILSTYFNPKGSLVLFCNHTLPQSLLLTQLAF